MQTKQNSTRPIKSYSSYFALVGCLVLILIVNYFLYLKLQNLFKERLQERLMAMAASASLYINTEDLENIQGPGDIGTKSYEKVVFQLRRIRQVNKNVKYVYILRKTEDPSTLQFVADADSLNPDQLIDLNGDGEINDADELNSPGDEYDVSEFSWLQSDAFQRPTVDPELTEDQWGTFLSSTAPIFNRNGSSNEILGIDVEVSDFVQITNLALVPYALFVIFLCLIITALTHFLVKLWKGYVETVQELDRQKDELLSIVSHQLATPATSVRWYLEMLLDGDVGKLSKEQKEHIDGARGIVGKLVDLIGMILDVSRIQLGKMKVDKQELDLNVFFKELILVIEPRAKQKQVNFNYKVPTNLPKAKLDKRLTNMTLENLLSNAVKYTPEHGKVDFIVEVKDKKLFFAVKDTGCGIPEKEQAKAFDKLFRASNVRNKVEGNGFGLYVAKGAVENQGGKISFQSQEGKGTTFVVELPLQ